jgi:hypothetical protein
MRAVKFFAASALLLALLAGVSSAEEKYELAYKFRPQEKVRWEIVHRATITTTIKNTTQTAQTLSESVKVWEVTDVKAGGEIEFVHSVESVKMTNKLPNRAEIKYDSRADKEPPPGYEDAARAVGVPLTVARIDRRGEVLDRTQKHVQLGNRDDMPIAMLLPAEPVAVGDSWGNPNEVLISLQDGRQQKITTRQRFELQSVEDGVAVISLDYQVLTPIRDPAIKAQLMQRLFRGEIKFDIDRGRIIAQHMKVDERVLGFSGPASSMHYLMSYDETLLEAEKEIARKPAETK